MNDTKHLIKLTNLLLYNLRQLKTQRLINIKENMEQLSCKCSQIVRNSALLKAAISRGWHLSAEKIKSRLNVNIAELSYTSAQLKNVTSQNSRFFIRAGDIFAELKQIEQEFGGFKFDFELPSISVISRPVVLDDIELGPFEIKLLIEDICRLHTESPYRVIALEPNTAAANPDVTHPHVSCERLCEGDGYVSIARSLEQGRLFDFFSIIENILHTYNPDSPYVSLADWSGVPCYDCGYTISDEEAYYCEQCDRDFCDSCVVYCCSCDLPVCHSCSVECPDCGQIFCRSCTAACTECSQIHCRGCLGDEKICNECTNERKENEHEEQTQEQLHRQDHPPVQSDSLVEAAFHARHGQQ